MRHAPSVTYGTGRAFPLVNVALTKRDIAAYAATTFWVARHDVGCAGTTGGRAGMVWATEGPQNSPSAATSSTDSAMPNIIASRIR